MPAPCTGRPGVQLRKSGALGLKLLGYVDSDESQQYTAPMARERYLVWLGASGEAGRLNKAYWPPLIDWLAAHCTSIRLVGSSGVRTLIGKAVRYDRVKVVLVPDTPLVDCRAEADGAALRQILETVHYSCDGEAEYICLFAGAEVVAFMRVEDENILTLNLTLEEMRGLIGGIGDLSENLRLCREHDNDARVCIEEAVRFLGAEIIDNKQWHTLGLR
jgi:hypothetical protein